MEDAFQANIMVDDFQNKWYSFGIYSWNIKYFDNSADTKE